MAVLEDLEGVESGSRIVVGISPTGVAAVAVRSVCGDVANVELPIWSARALRDALSKLIAEYDAAREAVPGK